MSALRDDIAKALNSHSAENGSDTPDFILAEYLMQCLAAFDAATEARREWYGDPTFDERHKLSEPLSGGG